VSSLSLDAKPGYSSEHRHLILYCRVQILSLAVRRFLRVGERIAASRLTSILTFAELADQFLSWAKPNLSKATVKLHRVNIQRLKQFFRGNLINELDRKSVESQSETGERRRESLGSDGQPKSYHLEAHLQSCRR
jgi:hypothetical protein